MNMKRRLAGVTLIELLIVMAILPMLLIVVSSMFGTFMDSQERTVAQSAIDLEQQYLMEKLFDDISQASAIVVPATDGATGAVLSLQQDTDLIEYFISGVTLMRADGEPPLPVTSTRVLLENFTVQRLGNEEGNDSVKISFSLASTASASLGMATRTLTTTYTLR